MKAVHSTACGSSSRQCQVDFKVSKLIQGDRRSACKCGANVGQRQAAANVSSLMGMNRKPVSAAQGIS